MANRKNETIYPENDNEFTKKEPLIRGGVQLEYKANEEFGGMGFYQGQQIQQLKIRRDYENENENEDIRFK